MRASSPSSNAPPERPRLAEDVAARRHVVDGEPLVVLHGPPPNAHVARLGEREWTFISCADGTRDLEGIRLAALARGRKVSRELLETFFTQLASAGFVVDGPGHEAMDAAEIGRGGEAHLPLVGLEGFALTCDGGGTCCRIFPTTTFLSLDVVRARSACPDVLDGGHDAARVFMPLSSSAANGWAPRAVTMVDGRCAYLRSDNSCRIHHEAGADLKPSGCRAFPLRYVSDGRTVRVGPSPECRCVFTSKPTGSPPPPPPPDAATVIETVPREVRVGASVSWSRDRYLAWADDVADQIASSSNLPALFWQLAHALDPSDETVEDGVHRLGETLAQHNAKQGFRAPRDLARIVPKWMEEATRADAAPPASAELFYGRAVAHLHAWTLERHDLATDLRERAVRLLVARRLTAVIKGAADTWTDAAWDEPIPLVEAICRGFNLRMAEARR